MPDFSKFLFFTLTVGTVSSICYQIAHKKLYISVKSAVSFMLVVAVFSTLFSLCEELDFDGLNFPDFTDEDSFSETVEDAFKKGVIADLEKHFSVADGKIRMEVSGFASESLKCERIIIYLDEKTVDYRSVKEYVKENFILKGGEVTVEYGF